MKSGLSVIIAVITLFAVVAADASVESGSPQVVAVVSGDSTVADVTVPEFSTVAASMALVGASVGYLAMRRFRK